MDPTRDGTAHDDRVAEIRSDIELARTRIVETIDALEYKADVPARLADVLSTTASSITARILQRIPSPSRTSKVQEGEALRSGPAETPHARMPVMRAELSREGQYAGVVFLLPDKAGVNVDMSDPELQEQVERAFRESGPRASDAGSTPGWEELTRYGDPVWFEEVLSALQADGYAYSIDRVDETPAGP
jgi:Protein of unknown function (DUF3618)